MRFLNIVDTMNEWTAKLFSPLVLLIMVIAVYEVIKRYFFSDPTTWAWEINAQLMCIMGAFSGGYALLKKAHVTVDIIYAKLKPKTKAILDLSSCILFFFLTLALIWFGSIEAFQAYVSNQTVHSQFATPLWPAKMFIAIGTVFMILQGVAKVIRDIRIIKGFK